MIFNNALPIECSYSFLAYSSAVVDPKLERAWKRF